MVGMDSYGRIVDYLRISVTDRCNERCLYCMPEGYKGWESRPDHLTAEEIIRVARVATGLGFRKFRLTGGEPLVRRDVPEIIRHETRRAGVPFARRRFADGQREPGRARSADLQKRQRRRGELGHRGHSRGGGRGF